jgi:signal peptidase II
MLSFLDEYLKYIQLILVSGVLGYTIYLKKICYAMPVGILLGGAFSNVYDRFIYGGVVDMVYWHCGFDFAIFNFADVMIDLSVVMILWIYYKNTKAKNANLW